VGVLDTPDYATAVEIIDGFAYVADFNSGLRIIDVVDPADPVELGAFDTPGAVRGFAVAGDLAYVADHSNGRVIVIDVSNSEAPFEICVFDTPGRAHDVEVVDGLFYVAEGTVGLRVIDFGPECRGTLPIDINIKPGSDLNKINPTSRGVVPAAIFGSDDFYVADIDVSTLAFGPGRAPPTHSVAVRHLDVNTDGFGDLLAHFRIAETGIEPGNTESCLSGETLDGQRFEGCGPIQTVPQ
jgi:hypothetical protein